MVPRRMLAPAALGAWLAVGCVVGSPRRPTQAEAAGGPPPPPAEDGTAARMLAPLPDAHGEPGAAPAKSPPGQVWMAGYWHWDGVRYTWIPGHWEPEPLPARD